MAHVMVICNDKRLLFFKKSSNFILNIKEINKWLSHYSDSHTNLIL